MDNFLFKVVRGLGHKSGGGYSPLDLRCQRDLGLVDIGLSPWKYQPNLIRLCFNYITTIHSGNMKNLRFKRNWGGVTLPSTPIQLCYNLTSSLRRLGSFMCCHCKGDKLWLYL